jgi:hypothetical protein
LRNLALDRIDFALDGEFAVELKLAVKRENFLLSFVNA